MSLSEVVLAIFLLTAVVLMFVGTFHRALGYRRWSQRQMEATLLARSELDQLRLWARNSTNFSSDWSTKIGSKTRPDHPGFTVLTERGPARELLSPASSLEVPSGDPRRFPASAFPVAVEVAWSANGPRDRVRLTTLISEPNRLDPADDLTIRLDRVSGPNPLSGQQEADYRATALLPGGAPVDAMFFWSVVPMTGNATLLPPISRDGRQVRVKNALKVLRTGGWQVWPGQVRLMASTSYFGRTFSGTTVVDLGP